MTSRTRIQTHVETRPLPPSAHTRQPWRIHELAPDFRLEDVWALPTPGGPDDLSRLVELVQSGDDRDFPVLYRLLFAIRWKLGGLLRLDREESGVGSRVASLRDRLPADLRDLPRPPDHPDLPFRVVYLTDREFVAEIANSTVHGLMHLGWVEDGEGGYRGQMAVLNKPNGLLGQAYMAFIKPFRYLVIYPALLRTLARGWESQAGGAR
ncbi:DUF2867 domain-containing protein [Nocardioides gansuensis]|uniref:DUF2867 domain-containing protein n=1 Tax=Nocardioides gansuensis TaxID=2138300 RepID=A0A2T8F7P1_9ACTN|nr:DUF2867 domain-containing protein [Nocardioides gansuensis]PVG81709.1 DUF2867 domain-containing protein [Nocardioides gansuensis]